MKRPARFPNLPTALALAAGVALVWSTGPVVNAAPKAEDPKAAPPAGKKASDPKAGETDAKPTTNTPPITISFPKAVFKLTLDAGNDPFFPTSKRRIPKPVEVIPPPPPVVPVVTNPPPVVKVAVVTNPPQPQPPKVTPQPPTSVPPTNQPPVVEIKPDLLGAANLSLRGISGTQNRRVAVIHTGAKSYDFIKGELMLLRLPNEQQLKVRCVEIRDRSAVFQVDGEKETKELFLREGL